MTTLPILLGLSLQAPVLMIVSGLFISAALPHVLLYLHRRKWQFSILQFIVGIIPVSLFVVGLEFFIRICEMERQFQMQYWQKSSIDPISHMLYMSREYAILFFLVTCLSVSFMVINLKRQSS